MCRCAEFSKVRLVVPYAGAQTGGASVYRSSTERIDQANWSFTQEGRVQTEGEKSPSSKARKGWFRESNLVQAAVLLPRSSRYSRRNYVAGGTIHNRRRNPARSECR